MTSPSDPTTAIRDAMGRLEAYVDPMEPATEGLLREIACLLRTGRWLLEWMERYGFDVKYQATITSDGDFRDDGAVRIYFPFSHDLAERYVAQVRETIG